MGMTIADRSASRTIGASAALFICAHMFRLSPALRRSLADRVAGILQTFVINFVLALIAWIVFCFIRPKFPKAYKARATEYAPIAAVDRFHRAQ